MDPKVQDAYNRVCASAGERDCHRLYSLYTLTILHTKCVSNATHFVSVYTVTKFIHSVYLVSDLEISTLDIHMTVKKTSAQALHTDHAYHEAPAGVSLRCRCSARHALVSARQKRSSAAWG